MTHLAGGTVTGAAAASRHGGFFVLRTPLLPFSVVTDLSAGLEAAASSDATTHQDALAREDRKSVV